MCETPKSSRQSSVGSTSTEDFKIISIPTSHTPKVAGNLTGNHRIVRDCVADIYNSVQQWNKHFLTGVQILSEIKNLKFDAIDNNKIYCDSLQEYCGSLEDVISAMTSIVDLLRTYVKTMTGVEKLLTNEAVIFSTWKFSTFVTVSQHVLSSYEKELALKTYVKEHIAHVSDKNSVAFYFITWVNEAFISEELGVQLEAMLLETGHR